MDATVTLDSPEQATFLANMPQLAGNWQIVRTEGSAVTFDTSALEILAGLDEDNDGHYDGTHIWIGGSEYRVVRHTGRKSIGPEVKTRLPKDDIAELEARAAAAGIDRSELLRRYAQAALAVEPTDPMAALIVAGVSRAVITRKDTDVIVELGVDSWIALGDTGNAEDGPYWMANIYSGESESGFAEGVDLTEVAARIAEAATR